MESVQPHEPWNKGKLVGQKLPLTLKDIWAIRIQPQFGKHVRIWRTASGRFVERYANEYSWPEIARRHILYSPTVSPLRVLI